jgi:purine-binding chemotaxis protein CheW
MSASNQIVVFTLDHKLFGLSLSNVERVVRAVEISPVPDSPEALYGVINVEGRIIPVVNSRRRLGLPEREPDLEDRFIIARENGCTVALVVDEVRPVVDLSTDGPVSSDAATLRTGFVRDITDSEDGIIMILSVDRALSTDQRFSVRNVIEEMEGHEHV